MILSAGPKAVPKFHLFTSLVASVMLVDAVLLITMLPAATALA